MLRKICFILFLMATCIIANPMSIETVESAPNCKDGWCEDTFESGSRTHEIGYPQEMSSQAQVAQQAVIKSFEVLQPIWGEGTNVPFNVYLILSPTSPGSTLADAEEVVYVVAESDGTATIALELEKCHITMYKIPDSSVWESTIAHEMGHCFQYSYISTFDYKPPDDNWWSDGSAEWMATLVYPDLAKNYLATTGPENNFAKVYFTPLFQKQYDAVYFWQFLDNYLGRDAVIALLVNLPDAGSVQDFEDYLKSALPDADEAMQQFAVALYNEQIPYQPGYTALNTISFSSPVPYAGTISAGNFSVEYRNFNNISVAEDNALRIVVTGTTEVDIRTTLLTDSITYTLPEGQAVDLCDPPSTITIASSRTGTINEDVNANIEISEVDGETANCIPEQSELPDCMIGTWYVTDLPEIATPEGVTIFWEPSNYYLTLNQDGSFEGVQLDMVSIADAEGIQSETTINLEFSGSLIVEPDPITTDQYEVTDMDVTIQSASFIVDIGGETVDMTDMILGMGSEGLVPPFRYFTCTGPTQLQYTVEAEGIQMTFMTEKAP